MYSAWKCRRKKCQSEEGNLDTIISFNALAFAKQGVIMKEGKTLKYYLTSPMYKGFICSLNFIGERLSSFQTG